MGKLRASLCLIGVRRMGRLDFLGPHFFNKRDHSGYILRWPPPRQAFKVYGGITLHVILKLRQSRLSLFPKAPRFYAPSSQ